MVSFFLLGFSQDQKRCSAKSFHALKKKAIHLAFTERNVHSEFFSSLVISVVSNYLQLQHEEHHSKDQSINLRPLSRDESSVPHLQDFW
jgi:hypothetical protein